MSRKKLRKSGTTTEAPGRFRPLTILGQWPRLKLTCFPNTGNRNLAMPTVLRSGPYRFYFWSHELNESPHIHVDRQRKSAKFWLQPIALARNLGFKAHEL